MEQSRGRRTGGASVKLSIVTGRSRQRSLIATVETDIAAQASVCDVARKDSYSAVDLTIAFKSLTVRKLILSSIDQTCV